MKNNSTLAIQETIVQSLSINNELNMSDLEFITGKRPVYVRIVLGRLGSRIRRRKDSLKVTYYSLVKV